jgi:hypothetical protein
LTASFFHNSLHLRFKHHSPSSLSTTSLERTSNSQGDFQTVVDQSDHLRVFCFGSYPLASCPRRMSRGTYEAIDKINDSHSEGERSVSYASLRQCESTSPTMPLSSSPHCSPPMPAPTLLRGTASPPADRPSILASQSGGSCTRYILPSRPIRSHPIRLFPPPHQSGSMNSPF